MKNYSYTIWFFEGNDVEQYIANSQTEAEIKAMANRIERGKSFSIHKVSHDGKWLEPKVKI